MLISYGLRKARCHYSKGQNKTAHNRVPPKGRWDFFSKKVSNLKAKFRWWCPGAMHPGPMLPMS